MAAMLASLSFWFRNVASTNFTVNLCLQELERVVKLSEKSRVREAKEKNEKYRKAVEELKRLESTQRELKYRFKV